MDLFRYTAPDTPDYSNGRDGATTYFSYNGGAALSDQGLPGKGAPTLSYNNHYNSYALQTSTRGDTDDWNQKAGLWLHRRRARPWRWIRPSSTSCRRSAGISC